jgi:hypothetical protein
MLICLSDHCEGLLMKSSFKQLKDSNLGKYLAVFHPYLFAIYPVAAAMARNSTEIRLADTLRPLFITLFIALILFFFLQKKFQPVDRAGLLTSLLLLFFFHYGYYYKFPETYTFLGLQVNRHMVIILLWLVFITIVTSQRIWMHVRPQIITRYLNILSMISFVFPFRLILIFAYWYAQDPLRDWQPNLPPIAPPSATTQTSSSPDIYYIILDGYGRQDILQELYGFDNSNFIDFLQERNFYIANDSRSNYNQTALSLASSLNLDYLYLPSFAGDQSNNRDPLKEMIQDSRLVNFLMQRGYTILALDSGFDLTNDISATKYLTINNHPITNFESLLLQTSAFRIPFDLFGWRLPIPEYSTHRERILTNFQTLGTLSSYGGPKFVFAHIMAPHPPFIFDANGNPLAPDRPYSLGDGSHYQGTSDEYVSSYVQQLAYLNKLVMGVVNELLANSAKEPIIILQADHGPGAYLNWDSLELSCVMERTSILNAYYLPNQDILYPSITPVNTFRIILDNYFNTNLGILPDKAYFAIWQKPYKFVDVTNSSEPNCK